MTTSEQKYQQPLSKDNCMFPQPISALIIKYGYSGTVDIRNGTMLLHNPNKPIKTIRLEQDTYIHKSIDEIRYYLEFQVWPLTEERYNSLSEEDKLFHKLKGTKILDVYKNEGFVSKILKQWGIS